MNRIIMHYDMDAFYASIEIRDKPHLKGKPVIVGRRVITTCNYEARKFGLHSAMSVVTARRLCPQGIYLPVDKDKYIKEAEIIQNLILKLSDKTEFIAFDEGFVDISHLKEKYPDINHFASVFRNRIFKHTGLSCSVGIGYNKLSAKLASEVNKPNGQFIIKNENEFKDYVFNKDIKILPGVGKKTQEILRQKNINKVSDLLNYSLLHLQGLFGHIKGQLLYEYALGIDTRPVKKDHKYKSIGNETTYSRPITDQDFVYQTLDDIFTKVLKRMEKKFYHAKTATIKIRYGDRQTFTRSKSLKIHSNNKQDLRNLYLDLKEQLIIDKPVMLAGFSLSNLIIKKEEQLTFESVPKLRKKKTILELQDKINHYEDIF